MLKTFFAFIIAINVLTVNTLAATSSGLKTVFDELNYSLTVEWDQKDKEFYTSKMRAFRAEIQNLQDHGLSQQELVDFVKSEIKDEKIAKDLETALSFISINNMTKEEASKYMVETMKNSYQVGANYRGQVQLILALGALFVVLALTATTRHVNYVGQYCSQIYVCGDYCHDDIYYGVYCDRSCYWTCQ